ncbi:MAG TPA: carbohydrate-binding module family 20 domain-containing protein [Verrucomicrobiae bacterium]
MAVPVTFQIDLGPRINLGEFDQISDIIEVRGDFTDWNGGFQLTNSTANPTIYTGTRDIAGPTGTNVLFKFVQSRGDLVTWENDPNRSISLPADATTLPVFYFNNVWEGAPIPVTFQVNMATQQAAGAFVPSEGDFVEVRGSFQGWTGGFQLSPSATNPDIYEGTAEVPDAPGARVEYKFVINKASTAAVNWENDPNRAFTQTAEPQTLPVVYFNNVTGVPVKAATSFAVDMSVYIGAGLFDTNTQEVYIRGNKVGWDAPPQGLQLFADASRPGVYTNTYRTDGQITGDLIEYKAVIWDPSLATTTWEDGGNKSLTFTGTEAKDASGYHQQNIPVWYFNNVQPGTLLNEETIVTFRVNMNNAVIGTNGPAFNPTTDTVAVNGAFLPGGWQPWDSLTTQAVDDGTNGDATAGDGIYTVQVTLPRGANSRLIYKYGINGQDNEAAAGTDRIRYIRETGAFTLPLDVWANILDEDNESEDIGEVAINRTAGEVTINWTAQPGVRLQRITNLATGEATDIAGTEGQGTYNVETSGQMGFFRLARP